MTPITVSRLATSPAYAVLPAEDIHRAHRFYEETLGLEVESPSATELYVSAGSGTKFMIYERARTKAEHTVMTFLVDDLKAAMSDLVSRGVKFEEYDLPYLKTVGGIAESPTELAAWFTDTEGNIINLAQMK